MVRGHLPGPRGLEEARRRAEEGHEGSEDVILATDYDREGEAIAYHVATLLGVDPAQASA